MVRSSGRAAGEVWLFLITYKTISGEKRGTELSSGHSFKSFRLTIRVVTDVKENSDELFS